MLDKVAIGLALETAMRRYPHISFNESFLLVSVLSYLDVSRLETSQGSREIVEYLRFNSGDQASGHKYGHSVRDGASSYWRWSSPPKKKVSP